MRKLLLPAVSAVLILASCGSSSQSAPETAAAPVAEAMIKTSQLSEVAKTAKFVTAAPLDFEQIESISKFRSCAGHDYSGKNIDGVVESGRSMKHYVSSIMLLAKAKDQVKIFAPFDAVVINNSRGKKGDNLDLSPTTAQDWIYELGHIVALDNLTEGTKVTAGQLVGYSDSANEGRFDLQFWYGSKNTINSLNGYFDSLFAHMTPELAAKLELFGLTESNLVVSKAARDADPCKSSGQQSSGDDVFVGDMQKDFVQVQNLSAKDSPQASSSNTGDSTAECDNSVPASKRPPGCAGG